jgi:nucleoside-diphosphate kinase
MQTLAIIKPDAVAAGLIGKILAHLESEGFSVRAAHMVRLTQDEAEAFYAVHKGRPFFTSLVRFMTSGPCLPVVLERDNAVEHLRVAIGATDPAEAAQGTVRRRYAESKERNAIHASDSPDNAQREIGFFVAEGELCGLWGSPV